MIRMLTALALVLALGAAAAAQEPGRRSSPPAAAPATALNLNTASASMLEGLPGIGKATAERIVEYRQKSGGFKKIEELMNVRGIGEKSFLTLKPLVTVTAPKSEPGRPVASEPGFTLLEMMAVAALLLLLSAIAIPQALASADRSKGRAAARFLAGRMTLARAQAVGHNRTMALVFERDRRGIAFRVHQDGNRNGVRAADIRDRIDLPIEEPVRLFELFPGVAIGVSPATPVDDPVRLGGSDILSFTPGGTSSSGTIYIAGRDGTQWAVRVLGATGRTRVLRYDPEDDAWIALL